MNSIKITLLIRKRFAELLETRIYRKRPLHQFVVRHYRTDNQKIIIDEEK